LLIDEPLIEDLLGRSGAEVVQHHYDLLLARARAPVMDDQRRQHQRLRLQSRRPEHELSAGGALRQLRRKPAKRGVRS
jgi:hypothetical protein